MPPIRAGKVDFTALGGNLPSATAVDSPPSSRGAVAKPELPMPRSFCLSPAGQWQDALLTGNGRLGMMVMGEPLDETLIFCGNDFHHPSRSKAFLPDISGIRGKVQDLVMAGKNKAAAQFQLDALLKGKASIGGEGAVHTGYQLLLHIPTQGKVRDYLRSCDFGTGEISVRFIDDRGKWTRQAFVSRADDCAVLRLIAPGKGKLDCSLQLSSCLKGKPGDWTFEDPLASEDGWLSLKVAYPADADQKGYKGVCRVKVKGGSFKSAGGILTVSKADSLLILSAQRRYQKEEAKAWEGPDLKQKLEALDTDYAVLLKRHQAIHGVIYGRVALDLGADAKERALSNEALLRKQADSPAPVKALWERAFAAGRYHFLSACSAQTPPQGIGLWTAEFNPAWGGFYHTDANLNVSVGGGNIGDLPEAMEGYFATIESWLDDWRYNSRRILGCRGFLPDGQGPQGQGNGVQSDLNVDWPYQYFTGRMGWLFQPFWEHYLVTGDKGFLEKRFFPILKEMAQFYEDFLKRRDKDGNFVFVGSISPECAPSGSDSQLALNSTIDVAAAKFILRTAIKACQALGIEDKERRSIAKWQSLLERMPAYAVDERGEFKEWLWPTLKNLGDHRHVSHLTTVWPFHEVNPEDTPQLIEPCLEVLRRRGYEDGSGHGVVMRALVAAGLKSKAQVRRNLDKLMREGYLYDSLFSSHNPGHDVFWSDVTNALPAIMMEMLVDSRPGHLELLPALPDELGKGRLKGLKCRNQVTVKEVAWDLKAGSVKAILASLKDQDIALVVRGGPARQVRLKAGAAVTIHEHLPPRGIGK